MPRLASTEGVREANHQKPERDLTGVKGDLCRDSASRVFPSSYRNNSATRLIAGCFRFFTLTQCFDRPAR